MTVPKNYLNEWYYPLNNFALDGIFDTAINHLKFNSGIQSADYLSNSQNIFIKPSCIKQTSRNYIDYKIKTKDNLGDMGYFFSEKFFEKDKNRQLVKFASIEDHKTTEEKYKELA